MKTLTKQEFYEVDRLGFLYNESQIDFNEFYNELVALLGAEHVVKYKWLTGQYPGHTIDALYLKNVTNSPFDIEDDDPEDDGFNGNEYYEDINDFGEW